MKLICKQSPQLHYEKAYQNQVPASFGVGCFVDLATAY
jgi:hypothetical protein